MKRTISLLLTGTILVSSAVTSLASNEVIEVYLNGAKVEFDTDPEIVNDRTFVPLRAIVEGFDAEVQWDGATQSITIAKDGASNYLKIGDVNVSTEKDGKTEMAVLDAAPYIKDERTMVPLRYISEGFGMEVQWDGETRTININNADTAEKQTDTENIARYGGFSYIPDFGAYFGVDKALQSTDEMYFYENVTEEQKSAYSALLLSLGFSQIDELTGEMVTSLGYEKENEQIVTASFDGVFGITVMHRRDEFAGEVAYYKNNQSVPDYGAVNGLETINVATNYNGSVTYIYRSASGADRARQILTYIDVLEGEGFVETEKTMTTLKMTKPDTRGYVIIKQSTDDIRNVEITTI